MSCEEETARIVAVGGRVLLQRQSSGDVVIDMDPDQAARLGSALMTKALEASRQWS